MYNSPNRKIENITCTLKEKTFHNKFRIGIKTNHLKVYASVIYTAKNIAASKVKLSYYIITLRIQAFSLVESHDLLEDRRTELRHTKPYPIAFPYLYRSCTRDICKISTFSNFQMFGWIKSKLFTCLIQGFSFYSTNSAIVSHFFVLPTL